MNSAQNKSKLQSNKSSSSDLLEALTNLNEEVRDGLDLIKLREETEKIVQKLYQKRYKNRGYGPFPMFTGIFLEKDFKKTSIFYTFTLIKKTAINPDFLNLQIIPYIGKPYPSINEEISFIDIALKERVPLYGELIGHSITVDIDNNKYHVRKYNCWKASEINFCSSRITSLGEPLCQDVTIYEPDAGTIGSDPDFFENILFSTHQVWWPYSDKTNILTTTIISLKGFGKGNKSIISKCLPELILDCSIGMVISQLFLTYALVNTSLRNLEPLVQEILRETWIKLIQNNKNNLEKKNDNVQFSKNFLELIFKIPFPHVLVSVIRYFLNERVKIEGAEFAELLEPRLKELSKLDFPAMGSLIVSGHENEKIKHFYRQIIDNLLQEARINLKQKNNVEQLKLLIGNLGEFLEYNHEDILSFVIKLSKKKNLTFEIRQEIFGILIKSISIGNKTWEGKFGLWKELTELILNSSDKNQIQSFTDCAATLLSQQGLDSITEVITLLKLISLPEKRTNSLYSQLENLRHRLQDKSNTTPKLIGVFSQKGGVGKSTVALMTASRLATSLKKKVCLVELDFGGPSFHNYKSVSNGPFINEFFELATTESNIQECYNTLFKEKLPTITTEYGKLSIWPASPRWEDQMQFTTPNAPYREERAFENRVLSKLISVLASDYDIIVFDVPAEIKDISRTVGMIISNSGGVILMVSSLFAPSYSPLIENYWRFFSNRKVVPALIINRFHLLDLDILNSCKSMVDYHLVQRNDISFRAFGMDIHSPALLRTFYPDKMDLIPIKNSEENERVHRNINIEKVIQVLSDSVESKFDSFLRKII